MTPAIEHQTTFNAILVQVLNGFVDESARLYAHLRNLVSALVRHTQTVLPVMDARDRVATALATTRAELILEAFDRRQESLARRLEGLLALKSRLEAVGEEVRAVRGALQAEAPKAAVAAAADRAAEDSSYVAFEGCFRGAPRTAGGNPPARRSSPGTPRTCAPPPRGARAAPGAPRSRP
jgi:hypothetical protein